MYATDPASLVAGRLPGPARAQGESKNWYFFSLVKPRSAQDSRKCRIVGGGKGTWKQERGNGVVGAAVMILFFTMLRLARTFAYSSKIGCVITMMQMPCHQKSNSPPRSTWSKKIDMLQVT